jgi:hypothetical protein
MNIGKERSAKLKIKKIKRSSRQGFGAHNLRHVLFGYESLSHSCAHFFARSNRGLAPDNPHWPIEVLAPVPSTASAPAHLPDATLLGKGTV